MEKPMNPSVEEKHMMQISIPLFCPAIARERGGSLARGVRSARVVVICFVINGIRMKPQTSVCLA